jgi:NAD(P)-dependent dehydrogenase (short-subunit alcohol dehydrogenase family)
MSLKGKTLFISGASRGVGLAIAVRAARDGANVALIAKTAEPHPKLEGTVYTAAGQIEEAGGRALPVVGDIRDEAQVERAAVGRSGQVVLGRGVGELVHGHVDAVPGAVDEAVDRGESPRQAR